MSVTSACGFETQSMATELAGGSLSGTSSFSQTQVRSGAWALRSNPASSANGYANLGGTATFSGGFCHFGLYIATMPTVNRRVFGDSGGTCNLYLQSTGALRYTIATGSTLAVGSTVLATGTWYWIGMYYSATARNNVLVQIDGVNEITANYLGATLTTSVIGCDGGEASAINLYFDDLIVDGAAFLASSKVALLVPTADSAVGTGWTLGTGTAISGNSGSTAVKNTPPLGVADLAAGSDVKQIRNASANASVSYDATLTTYSAAGINAGDTVLAVQNVTSTAAPVTTSSKQGLVGMASNPAITTIALGAGGTAGAFWSGAGGGTYATGWKASFGTLTTSPSVTLGTAPVMRVTQVTSSTRIAVVCFMAAWVAWTPAAATQVPYTQPMQPLIAQ